MSHPVQPPIQPRLQGSPVEVVKFNQGQLLWTIVFANLLSGIIGGVVVAVLISLDK